MGLAFLAGIIIWLVYGAQAALQYASVYLIEQVSMRAHTPTPLEGAFRVARSQAAARCPEHCREGALPFNGATQAKPEKGP